MTLSTVVFCTFLSWLWETIMIEWCMTSGIERNLSSLKGHRQTGEAAVCLASEFRGSPLYLKCCREGDLGRRPGCTEETAEEASILTFCLLAPWFALPFKAILSTTWRERVCWRERGAWEREVHWNWKSNIFIRNYKIKLTDNISIYNSFSFKWSKITQLLCYQNTTFIYCYGFW